MNLLLIFISLFSISQAQLKWYNHPELDWKTLETEHFKIHFQNGDLKYERKLRKGSGESTYGIEIANAIGLDREFIANAFHFRNKYEGKESDVVSNKRSKYNAKKIVDKCEKCGEWHKLFNRSP